MQFIETAVSGAFVVKPRTVSDHRGSFAKGWSARLYQEHGLPGVFVEWNSAVTLRRGIVRGLHYQEPPHAEAKLLRCVRGRVFDVIVDLRKASPTFLQWAGVEMSADEPCLIYIPEGCAHGYQTLEDGSEVFYGASAYYTPSAERGIRWNDPVIGVKWPVMEAEVSEKDARWPEYDAAAIGPAAAGVIR